MWTPPIQIPVRLSVRGFSDYFLTDQAKDIQHNYEQITITPAAMYILSSIAGRRIVEPVRWVLLDGLQDILLGNLRTEISERQDLLASTFGEILGALILSLKLGGSVEIVRLLESNLFQTPDFVILHWTKSDKKVTAHLLECKGSVLDVNNLNQSRRVDVCQHLRNFRTDGQAQLKSVHIHNLKPGSGLRLGHQELPLGLTGGMTSKNLSVVSIPDGRILRLLDRNVSMPARACCGGAGIDCVKCMTDWGHQNLSNIIAVLHRKDEKPDPTLDMQIRRFIRRYQNAQRALWAEHDADLAETTSDLLGQLRERGLSSDLRTTFGLIAVSLLEAGITQELEMSRFGLENLQNLAVGSDILEIILNQLQTEIWREKRRSKKEIRQISPGQFIDEVSRGKSLPDDLALSTKYLVQDKDVIPPSLSDRDQEDFPDPTTFDTPSLQISSVKESFDNAELIRLTANQSTAQAFVALRQRAENIIQRLRDRETFIKWHDEYVQLNNTRIDLGISWDAFPYPHQSLQRPGITAWVARDGRAEIIVRYP